MESQFIWSDDPVHEPMLPLPYVRYPRPNFGTFIAFSVESTGPAYFCECAIAGIRNLALLTSQQGSGLKSDGGITVGYRWQNDFPHLANFESTFKNEIPIVLLQFRSEICHRCNLIPPTSIWAPPMYAGKFAQTYGYYIYQARFRLGLGHFAGRYLDGITPEDFILLSCEAAEANRRFREEESRLMSIVHGPPRADIDPKEITYWANVKMGEEQEMVKLRKAASQANNRLKNAVENIARTEFGFRKVGEGWVAETQLFKIVETLYPSTTLIRHLRPDWLEGLEIDIWLPDLPLAIEYQGQQHYKEVEHWGGHYGLTKLRERDKRKAKLLRDQGIPLLAIKYTEPLTLPHIQNRIKGLGISI